MAEIKPTLIPEKGSAGEFTFFTRNGKRLVRQRGMQGAKRALTPRMALSSSKISNVNCAWRSTNGKLSGLFETRKPGQTAYNVFMSQNLDRARVTLTKKQSDRHFCVADHFVVSVGTLLPSIEVSETDDYFLSDIRVGDSPITPQTTLFDLSQAVLNHNGDRFHYGDCITLLLFRQRINPNEGQPYLEVASHSVEVSRDYVDQYHTPLGGLPFRSAEGFLAYPKEEGLLVAWVQRRPQEKGPDRVTSQSLVGRNPILNQYIGMVATYEAIASYGPLKDSPDAVCDGMDFGQLGRAVFRIQSGIVPAPAADSPAPAPRDLLPLTLQVSSPQAGTAEGSGRFPKGAAVQITATPNEGYRFLCWDDGNEEPVRELIISEPATYKAIFGKAL